MRQPERSMLLDWLARRVRDGRRVRGWSRDELSRHSGLSPRFLSRVESGDGNISVRRLDELARALDTTADRLLRPPAGAGPVLSLVGLRGAGKSTVGPLLASTLGRRFVEIDQAIVETSGLELDQLFELHGEGYYRRLEQDVLRRLLTGREPVVLAAAGGVVNDPTSWRLLLERTTVVWLSARPEDHWNRLVAQGDRRPMADNPRAMDELRALLRQREQIYGEAQIVVETSTLSPRAVADAITARLRDAPAPHEP